MSDIPSSSADAGPPTVSPTELAAAAATASSTTTNSDDPPLMSRVKFVPFSSAVESSFWVRYNQLKLETIQLSEEPIPIQGTYTHLEPRLQCLESSLQSLLLSSQQQHPVPPSNEPNRMDAGHDTASTTTPTSMMVANERVHVPGILQGYNTMESFQGLDKNQFLKDQFLSDFCDNKPNNNSIETTTTTAAELEDNSLSLCQSLTQFVLLTFADLKQHKVFYWFGFPALATVDPTSGSTGICYVDAPKSLNAVVFPDNPRKQEGDDCESHSLLIPSSLQLAYQVHQMRQKLLQLQAEQLQRRSAAPSTTNASTVPAVGMPPYFVWYRKRQICQPLTKTVLQEYLKYMIDVRKDDSGEQEDHYDAMLVFLDPNTATSDPGWPLRNLIAYLSIHGKLGGECIPILSYRPGRLRRIANANEDMNHVIESDALQDQSLLLKLRIPTTTEFGLGTNNNNNAEHKNDGRFGSFAACKVTGWELNVRGKPGPRLLQLRPLLDPTHLAIQAADLNLQLMKWRMIPQLQISKLQSLRVLLLGAGTLGCNVARILLGWGIRQFTFVDNGTVNYSNPVRQPLFTLQDCQRHPTATSSTKNTPSSGTGGMPKAVAAAEALHSIAADVQAQGIVLSIPMPGHVESDRDKLKETVTQLEDLIQNQCDVVFLLTDTRESRWLPTVLAAVHDKPLINAALGLDTWLVMRHGGGRSNSHDGGGPQQSRLGCYFCNDVVAPENSTRNRTLDQQCTVTRPGLAPIASAMAVELMVSMLHHPAGCHAPAPVQSTTTSAGQKSSYSQTVAPQQQHPHSPTTELGLLPHQIRGSLVTYSMMTPTVPEFPYCTGCAPAVMDAYQTDSLEMVHQVCNDNTADYLEQITGLDKFRAQAESQFDEDDDLLFALENEEENEEG